MSASVAPRPRSLRSLGAAFGQQINTPASLTVCQPAALSWTGGTAPYYLSVLPGGQASGTPLESFGEQQGTSYTWTVNIASGTAITLALTDSTGKTGEWREREEQKRSAGGRLC